MAVGVLASGSGSLLQSLLDEQDEWYRIAVVVSDRPGVQALARAEAAGVPAVVCEFASYPSREAFSSAVAAAQRERDVELSASAGFARILSPNYFPEVAVPYINSHPALLPSFPGAHGVRDALAYGAKVTGTTIHICDEGVDTGPVIAQEAVSVLPEDTESSLHERIKTVERRLYPEVIRWFAQGRVKVEGRRVHVIG